MRTQDEMAHFLEQGYLHAPGVLTGDELEFVRSEFDRVWDIEQPRVSQHQLLKHKTFIDLIEHPAILARVQAVFGSQTQLLQYDLLRQGPRSQVAERNWHRDFTFAGDRPLAINVIVPLDEMNEERGPTRVVPKTHLGDDVPPAESKHEVLSGEVPMYANPGDAVFINGAIWHTGGRNASDGARRGIFAYYGYWWLKRYNSDQALPWQAFENASDMRLQLLGVKMPGDDIHMYEPDKK